MPLSAFRPGPALRVIVSVAVLALVLRAVDWPAFAGLAANIRWPILLLAAVLMGAAYPLQAVRLGLLLRQQGIALPFGELHRITWIGTFFGSFTPGGVGGDVSRLIHVYGRMPDNKSGATVAVIADRVIGLAVLLLLASTAALFRPHIDHSPMETKALVPAFMLAFAGLIAGWLILARLPENNRWATLASVSNAARKSLRPLSPLLAAAAVSLAIWIADFTAGWLLARALSWPTVWPISWSEVSVALAVAYAVASLPVSLGGHGVREGALVVVLGWFVPEDAAPLALAFLGLTIFWGLVGGVVWLVSPVKAPPAP